MKMKSCSCDKTCLWQRRTTLTPLEPTSLPFTSWLLCLELSAPCKSMYMYWLRVLSANIPDRSHLELIALDQGILGAIKEWLVPLADRSLPALNIQRALFAILAKVRGVFAAKS